VSPGEPEAVFMLFMIRDSAAVSGSYDGTAIEDVWNATRNATGAERHKKIGCGVKRALSP
jgi:hypothetical protein